MPGPSLFDSTPADSQIRSVLHLIANGFSPSTIKHIKLTAEERSRLAGLVTDPLLANAIRSNDEKAWASAQAEYDRTTSAEKRPRAGKDEHGSGEGRGMSMA